MGDAATTRDELRAWLAQHLTPELRAQCNDPDRTRSVSALREWNAALFDAGWAAPSWPVRFGGRDADLEDQLACHEEMAAANAPGPVNAIGVANIAPAIMTYGTEEQQERFIRPMLRGDDIWSQGMSEPEAGSDLSSLRCRAEIDGDSFVVTGQKTCGTPTATSPTGASCTCAPIRQHPNGRASRVSWSTCAHPELTYDRFVRWPTITDSPRCSSIRFECRARPCSVGTTTGGASPLGRTTTSEPASPRA
ncbi:MAG: acyl-CoA dehydrogenase family protein, partial [Planctomycetia bacterium]